MGLEDILKQIDELWPYVRISASDRAIEMINERAHASGDERVITQLAFTVDKDKTLTDEEMVELYFENAEKIEHSPPMCFNDLKYHIDNLRPSDVKYLEKYQHQPEVIDRLVDKVIVFLDDDNGTSAGDIDYCTATGYELAGLLKGRTQQIVEEAKPSRRKAVFVEALFKAQQKI